LQISVEFDSLDVFVSNNLWSMVENVHLREIEAVRFLRGFHKTCFRTCFPKQVEKGWERWSPKMFHWFIHPIYYSLRL
jgi:hypothetical protein